MELARSTDRLGCHQTALYFAVRKPLRITRSYLDRQWQLALGHESPGNEKISRYFSVSKLQQKCMASCCPILRMTAYAAKQTVFACLQHDLECICPASSSSLVLLKLRDISIQNAKLLCVCRFTFWVSPLLACAQVLPAIWHTVWTLGHT